MTPVQKERPVAETQPLQKLLHTVWNNPNLDIEQKIARTREILQVGPDTQLNPSVVLRSIRALRAEVNQQAAAYKSFLGRHYNPHYWSKADVKKWATAQKELGAALDEMNTALADIEKYLSYLERVASGKKPDPSILKLAPVGYDFLTPAKAQKKIAAAFEKYIGAANQLQAPSDKLRAVLGNVAQTQEQIQKYGNAMVGLALAGTGMWLGYAVQLGVLGSAALGGFQGGVQSLANNITSDKEFSSSDLLLSIGLGAVFSGAATKIRSIPHRVKPIAGVAGSEVAGHVVKFGKNIGDTARKSIPRKKRKTRTALEDFEGIKKKRKAGKKKKP